MSILDIFRRRDSQPHPNFPILALINRSTAYADSEIGFLADLLTLHFTLDFVPYWGSGYLVVPVLTDEKPPEGTDQLVIFDTSDQAGAAGYHELTSEGRALGKVFAATTIAGGMSPQVAACHEADEMNRDPYINTYYRMPDGRFMVGETSDPVNSRFYPLNVNGRDGRISDFVLPSWFDPNGKPPYTFGAMSGRDIDLTGPFKLGYGGYALVYDPVSNGWVNLTHDSTPASKLTPDPGGRRARRIMPREQWRTSEQ